MYEAMSRSERLDRWAMVLEGAEANVTPFRDVEFFTPTERANLRRPNSPLDIAFQDPVLRRAGLNSDRFGDGEGFFGLSTNQAHRVMCGCGYFKRAPGPTMARRIRAIAARQRLRDRVADAVPAFARWLAAPQPA